MSYLTVSVACPASMLADAEEMFAAINRKREGNFVAPSWVDAGGETYSVIGFAMSTPLAEWIMSGNPLPLRTTDEPLDPPLDAGAAARAYAALLHLAPATEDAPAVAVDPARIGFWIGQPSDAVSRGLARVVLQEEGEV